MVPSRRRPGALARLLRRRHPRRLPDPSLPLPRRRHRPQSRLRHRRRPCRPGLPSRLPRRLRRCHRCRGHPLPGCRQRLRRRPLPGGRRSLRRLRSRHLRRAPAHRQGQPPRPLPLRLRSHPFPRRLIRPSNRVEPNSLRNRPRSAAGSVARARAASASGGACRIPFAKGPRPRGAAFRNHMFAQPAAGSPGLQSHRGDNRSPGGCSGAVRPAWSPSIGSCSFATPSFFAGCHARASSHPAAPTRSAASLPQRPRERSAR